MRATDFLIESLSKIVYHYTNVYAAAGILETGEFKLSASPGSIEQDYAPAGHDYFLSTTRTRRGGYHNTIGDSAVLFVLDGNWFNSRYKSGPVDYWGDRHNDYGRTSEAEDRVFSKTPTIPVDGVSAVHVYMAEMTPEKRANWGTYDPGMVRRIMIAAKRRGIAAYLYHDASAWRALDTRKAVSVGQAGDQLRGEIKTARGHRVSRWLKPWLELLQAKSSAHLSKKANDIAFNLAYYSYDAKVAGQGLKNDLSNARKPSASDHNDAVKLITLMRQNHWVTIEDLVNGVGAKWKAIKQQERNTQSA